LVEESARAEGEHRLTAEEAARLRSVLPAYAETCAELAASGVASTLQHDDLHDGNVLARGPVFIDWGDAVVGHPFGTMLTTLNSVIHHHELAPDDPALWRLADAYSEAWTDVADRATLRRLLLLAVRVGPLTRAMAWRRALLGCDDVSWAEWGDGVHGWLLELLSPDLPLRPALLA
jgi:Ser/Thr protein kinase RdoA (MazF antagonist)